MVEHTTENRGVAGSIPALAISDTRPGSNRRPRSPEATIAFDSGPRRGFSPCALLDYSADAKRMESTRERERNEVGRRAAIAFAVLVIVGCGGGENQKRPPPNEANRPPEGFQGKGADRAANTLTPQQREEAVREHGRRCGPKGSTCPKPRARGPRSPAPGPPPADQWLMDLTVVGAPSGASSARPGT